MNLYKFDFYCGRMGELQGLFISTEEHINLLKGRTIYFGEVLGKHSEVICYDPLEHITILPIPSSAVETLKEHIGYTLSGYNPVAYVRCDLCEESLEKDIPQPHKGNIYCERCIWEIKLRNEIL